MVGINQERTWKIDTNNEHFIIMEISNGICKIEYLTNGRIQDKTVEEIEKKSKLVERSSFQYDKCSKISEYITGKVWLYQYRCRSCSWRINGCNYL